MTKNLALGVFILIIVFVGAGLFIQQETSQKNPLGTSAPDATFSPIQNNTQTANPTSPVATQMPQQSSSQSGSITTMPDGLQIEDLKVGTGPAAKVGDTITVNYVGTLTNGTKFDSSIDRGTPFTTQIGVGQVIKGWDEGIPGMKVGGIRRLIVPPSLGYGSQAVGSIPANSTLIFEVALLGIK